MIVMVLEKIPASLRGDLSRWLMEVKTGVYIGHVSGMVRDLLWEKCSQNKSAGSVFQAWTTNTEQHFKMRLSGCGTLRIVDWEGLQLVQETKTVLSKPQKRRIK